MVERVKVAEFGIINKQLALATVYIYEADANGESTGTLATLYAASTGVTVRSNPQTLDENGKLQNDVYVATDVVAAISGIGERAERAIRKIRQNPLEFSLPVTSANFYYTNSAADATAAAASAAAAATSETNAATSETNAAASASAASTSASNAATSASNALTSENNASASAAAAAASAAEGLYRDVVTLTNADSPYVPSAAEEGTLFRLDMTSGPIVINLSSLATYGEDMKFAFAKVDASGNSATINRGGTDTIEGATSITADTRYTIHTTLGDFATGTWLEVLHEKGIADGSVTNAKLANMDQSTIKGRASGAGTGSPTDLSVAQVLALLNVYTQTQVNSLLSALPFTSEYVSADQTITAAGALTLAHGLGAVPKVVQTLLECQTAEYGYSIGDLIVLDYALWTSTTGGLMYGHSLTIDATNISVRFADGASGNCYVYPRKDTGADVALTSGNWKLIVKAWA